MSSMIALRPRVAAVSGGCRGSRCRRSTVVPLNSTTDQAYTRADSLAIHHRCDDKTWRGYIGQWHLDYQDPEKARTIRGLRSFKWRDSSRQVLDQVNVYDGEKPPASRRETDGLYQANFFFDHSDPDQDKEVVVVSADSQQAHLLSLDPDSYAMLPFQLPGLGPQGQQQGGWGLELFIKDQAMRWSASLLYDLQGGGLARVNFIQEFLTDAKPSQPNVIKLAGCKIRQARESLDGDVAVWRVAPSGQASRLFRGKDGSLRKDLQTKQVQWSPPSVEEHPANQLLLLPDLMYVFAPTSLAGVAGAGGSSSSSSKGCHIEFGGLVRTGAHMYRVVVEYDGQGRLAEVTKQRFS